MDTRDRTFRQSLRWAPLLALLLLAACVRQDDQVPGRSATGAARKPVVVAGVAFAPPAAWGELGPNATCKARYVLAPVQGDRISAALEVYYFGPHSEGVVDATLDRWLGQITLPEGGDPAAAAHRSSFRADGMAGRVVALEGTFRAGGGPRGTGSPTQMRGSRLVGVALEGPQGAVFFRLTGPAATVKVMEAQLLAVARAAKKAE